VERSDTHHVSAQAQQGDGFARAQPITRWTKPWHVTEAHNSTHPDHAIARQLLPNPANLPRSLDWGIFIQAFEMNALSILA
jgi:hypothetical protein